MNATGARDERAASRTAKSCRPDALVAGVLVQDALRHARAVTTKPSLSGERV